MCCAFLSELSAGGQRIGDSGIAGRTLRFSSVDPSLSPSKLKWDEDGTATLTEWRLAEESIFCGVEAVTFTELSYWLPQSSKDSSFWRYLTASLVEIPLLHGRT